MAYRLYFTEFFLLIFIYCPFYIFLASLSLATFKGYFVGIATFAKSVPPQNVALQYVHTFVKHLSGFLSEVFGKEFKFTLQHILLIACLFALLRLINEIKHYSDVLLEQNKIQQALLTQKVETKTEVKEKNDL